jgi:hypothetical protein
MLSFFRLQVREGLKAPLGLSTDTEKSAFSSCLRGKQKGKRGLLKPLANERAESLKLLEEGQLGIVVFQSIGDKVRYIANPTRPVGGLKQGIGDAFLNIGATVTHHVRGPPAQFEKGLEIRFDPLTVPGLAQTQANDVDLFERQSLALT